ncbi:hypothetical protein DFJ58DRAFT_821258 [Suillus subalutaceus]|uniref:uncharacterized protein n=1 Tax=Suillus subalutaceus TaxID=48586 RepID=UPI001B85CA3D|nr:uncharacterized protein DFJ58DRAFT_821258 [Suillus subalutaceus]KAG1834919.1 hypothetical protein DFJ58DRAFT_821258 [Suillus subalutaceus]
MSSRSQLIACFPIVRYVPIPDVGHYDLTSFPKRLGESPVQNVYLEAHNAQCNICLVDFDPPPSKSSHTRAVAELESGPLIQLPCSHVFHTDCIGNWLFGNSTCPSCRANVISPVEKLMGKPSESPFLTNYNSHSPDSPVLLSLLSASRQSSLRHLRPLRPTRETLQRGSTNPNARSSLHRLLL